MPNVSKSDEKPESAFGVYKIQIDREWLFSELAELSDLYVQVYAFFTQLESQQIEIESAQTKRGGIIPAPSEILEVVDDLTRKKNRLSMGRRVEFN